MFKAFCGYRESDAKCDALPEVMSLESAVVKDEDFKFENMFGGR